MTELEHYGVKGMRWGVRRADRKQGGVFRRNKAKTDPAWTFAGNKGQLSAKRKYSDADIATLRRQVEGLRLESEYKKLTSSPSFVKQQTRQFVASQLQQNGGKLVAEAGPAILKALKQAKK